MQLEDIANLRQRTRFTAYNDWVAEFCAHDPKRLYGVGLISLEDIDAAVEDVERIAKQGCDRSGAGSRRAPPRSCRVQPRGRASELGGRCDTRDDMRSRTAPPDGRSWRYASVSA